MRWVFFVLAGLFLLISLALGIWQRWFFTPFLMMLFAAGLGVASCLTPPNWHPRLRKLFLFLAVPFAVLGAMFELALWRNKAEYQVDAVCDEFSVRTTGQASVEFRPTRFRMAVAEGAGLHVAADRFVIQTSGTSDPDLAAVSGQHKLVIKSLKPTATEELPFAAVTVDPDTGPDIKFELASPAQAGESGELRLTWDRALGARQALKVRASPLRRLLLQGLDYSLEVRNCTVEFGTYARDLKGNVTLKIRGQAPLRAVPVVLTYDPRGKETPEVNLNLGVRKDPLKVAITLAGDVRDPDLGRILTGRLNVDGGSPVVIKAGESLEPRISLVGDATIESCDLQADGIHLRVKGKASEITADKENRLPSKLSTLLKSTVALAFLVVITWLIDKFFNLYDVVKESNPAGGT